LGDLKTSDLQLRDTLSQHDNSSFSNTILQINQKLKVKKRKENHLTGVTITVSTTLPDSLGVID